MAPTESSVWFAINYPAKHSALKVWESNTIDNLVSALIGCGCKHLEKHTDKRFQVYHIFVNMPIIFLSRSFLGSWPNFFSIRMFAYASPNDENETGCIRLHLRENGSLFVKYPRGIIMSWRLRACKKKTKQKHVHRKEDTQFFNPAVWLGVLNSNKDFFENHWTQQTNHW